MNEEWEALQGLKIYLNRILSLRPAKNMSTMSFFLFNIGKELIDAIGEDAGFIGERERYLKHLYDLKLEKLSIEEAKVIDVILEGVEWLKEGTTLWEWRSDKHRGGIPPEFHGDEIFWTLDFAMMTDKEIEEDADPDPLSRLKSIGVKVMKD